MTHPSRRRVAGLLCAAGALALACGLAPAATAGAPEKAEVWVSSQAGDRLAARPALRAAAPASGAQAFVIDAARRDQTMIGFGASFLEAGAVSLNSLPQARQEDVLRALFDPQKGAGFSAMKTDIAASDFMSAGPYYSYDETPGDTGLKHFSIARDLKPDGLVRYIRRARRYGDFTLQATMDYPPDWMLVDARQGPNQDVREDAYGPLADYLIRYLKAYRSQGIRIDYLSAFNEPGNYTKIAPAKYAKFIADALGPRLAASGLKTRLQAAESPLRSVAGKDLPVILDDPAARRFISAITYHGYDFMFLPEGLSAQALTAQGKAAFETVASLHAKYPELPLWMTEVTHVGPGYAGKGDIDPVPYPGFDDGEFWGLQIAADLEAGASGWTYWNMILDEKGGPWLVSAQHGDPENNAQHPVVIINRHTGEVTYTGLYWYLAHFSRFVRPGSVRIGVGGDVPGVKMLAFVRPDGKTVAELINTASKDVPVEVVEGGRALRPTLAAHSITTLVW